MKIQKPAMHAEKLLFSLFVLSLGLSASAFAQESCHVQRVAQLEKKIQNDAVLIQLRSKIKAVQNEQEEQVKFRNLPGSIREMIEVVKRTGHCPNQFGAGNDALELGTEKYKNQEQTAFQMGEVSSEGSSSLACGFRKNGESGSWDENGIWFDAKKGEIEISSASGSSSEPYLRRSEQPRPGVFSALQDASYRKFPLLAGNHLGVGDSLFFKIAPHIFLEEIGDVDGPQFQTGGFYYVRLIFASGFEKENSTVDASQVQIAITAREQALSEQVDREIPCQDLAITPIMSAIVIKPAVPAAPKAVILVVAQPKVNLAQCEEERKTKIADLVASDPALQSLQAELLAPKNIEKKHGAVTAAFEKYPDLLKAIQEISNQVFTKHACPTKKIEGWDQSATAALNLYQQGQHQSTSMDQELSKTSHPAFWCGFQTASKQWFEGNLTSSRLGEIESSESNLQTSAQLQVTLKMAEIGVYQAVKFSDRFKSYRSGGDFGDAVYFKIGPGLFLEGYARTLKTNDMKSSGRGFYTLELIFTDEFFARPAPIIEEESRLAEIREKIEARKLELARTIPACQP